ncbi:CD63 antigen-like [Cylas formicarius]|uniref:CD63 antigen-like n=1 Tax=Cylas formicarius TaxID=197179 RepID=UPI0029583B56|nr:CD63 antigen-like [Cylas formicarius]
METCGMSLVKYILFAFNLIFAISGLGIIIAGGLVLSDVSDFKHFTDNDLLGPPVVLIVTGSIVFIIAFLGCFGAIRESYKMLMAFSALLLVIFIVELAAGIAAAVYKGDFQSTFKKTLSASMTNYSGNEVERISWDKIQTKFHCCGVDNPEDWKKIDPAYPKTCCAANPTPHDLETGEVQENDFCKQDGGGTHLYSRGCYDKLKMKVESNMKVLVGVGIGIAFVEVIGIVLACWLAYTIKKENETSK